MARVLVADDDFAIRDVIQSACKLDAHEVRTCADSDEAVAAYAEFEPELLILDISMPGGGALAILERIERIERETGGPPCPAIVVSGYLREDLEQHPRIAEVIKKPFGIDALRMAVKTVLAAR
jgi:CheY-like chemotaxis protein